MPDQAAILLAINQIYQDTPELFGDKANREKLKGALTAIMKDEFVRQDRVLGQVAEALEKHHVKLGDVRMALVGMHHPENIIMDFWPRSAFLFPVPEKEAKAKGAAKLFALFGKVTRFDGENLLDARTAEAPLHKHKYDVVMTGNVLNDPQFMRTALETYASCAALAKQGGRIIHLLGYSSHNAARHVEHPAVPDVCAQERTAQAVFPDRRRDVPFMVFRQKEDLRRPITEILRAYELRTLRARAQEVVWGQWRRPRRKAPKPASTEHAIT